MNDLRDKLLLLSRKCKNMDADTNRLIDECIRDVEEKIQKERDKRLNKSFDEMMRVYDKIHFSEVE